ncbi:sigma-70 family RNA polymerase sigma factor [Proteiniphilum sp. UBA5510]|uniref:sigma-70 family RNA polymerase sigma factor n=1 Tax=Proteiniphilum sp. UBA5510 TaxID=1947286 RepID=UPI00257FAAD1|nr:sigma-70 family RNA polymerase sigma factor [Proteiniphilum sp. UBA5510]
MTQLDDDKQLKDKLLSKNEKTVELLIEKYHKLLWVIVENTLRGIGRAEDIEECVSDVFVRIWGKPESFDPERGTMKTYLSVMAKSIALNRYKSLTKRYESESNNSVENENTDDLLDLICREERNEELLDAIHSLKDPYPEIFIRRYIFGEKTSVVASRLGMDTKDIENRIYRGKNKLKSILNHFVERGTAI